MRPSSSGIRRGPCVLRLAFFVSILVLLTSSPARSDERPVRTFGISVDGSAAESEWLLELLRSELDALLSGEFRLEFPSDALVPAGGTLDGARAAHDRLLTDPDLDLVISLGPLVSREMITRTALPRPVIAPFVLDVLVDTIPRGDGGGSGVVNLCYVEPVFDFEHDVRRFRELVDFGRMAVLGRPGLIRSLRPHTDQVADLAALDLQLYPVAIEGDPAALVSGLPEGIDAALIIGPPQRGDTTRAALLEELHARGIPTFSVAGEIGVRDGALAGLVPADWWPRVMRRVALNARRILTGDPAAEIPVQLRREETYYVNMATARRLGISPPSR